MNDHFDRILILAVMTILVGLFAWIDKRDRDHRARRWMIGWMAIEFHFAAAVLASFALLPPRLYRWTAYATLIVAAANFFLSVWPPNVNRRKRAEFWLLLFTPTILFLSCRVLGVPGYGLTTLLMAVFLNASAAMLIAKDRPVTRRWSPWLLVSLPLTGISYLVVRAGIGLDVTLFLCFAATGLAYWRRYARFSPGVCFTSLSFFAWGLVWPVTELLLRVFHTQPSYSSVIWDLPKYFVAFGMIMTLFENQTEVLQSEARERKQAVESLRESETSLAHAQQMAHVGSWESSIAGLLQESPGQARWSAETYRIFGVPEGAEPSRAAMMAATHEEDRPAVQAAAQALVDTGEPYEIEYRILRPSGEVRHVRERAEIAVDQTGKPGRVFATLQDITDYRALQDRLYEAERLESLGRLAGGVAHDFNNLLTVINGYTELLLRRTVGKERSLEYLNEIHSAGERASQLTSQLLCFSRKHVVQPEVLNLNHIVTGMQRMLERLIGEDIRIVTTFGPGLLPVMADGSQIEQAIMNLAVNARDAMPRGGTLTLATANVICDPAQVQGPPDAKPGEYVMLTVADTGTGMSPEVKARAFEPFFTTKEAGRGTGLGLAMVHGIIRQAGGWISVSSSVGVGTTFAIYLPPTDVNASRTAASVPAGCGGSETVLVVEDQAEVRSLIAHSLEDWGYVVLKAGSGEEALAVCDQRKAHVDLVLTDVIMPGMNGHELAQRLCKKWPSTQVLYMSGYVDDVFGPERIIDSDLEFLQKPFTPSSLAVRVREMLDRRNGDS